MAKFPFKNYTVIPTGLILYKKFSTSDVYRLFVLSLTADKKSGVTDTTIKQLASFVNESSENYKTKPLSFVDKLKDSNYVGVNYSQILHDHNSIKTRIEYTFSFPREGEPFRMVYRDFIELDIPIKLKGYILKLFAVANTLSLEIGYSVNKLEQLLSMDRRTILKYNEELEALGLLQKIENGIKICCSGIIPIKKQLTEETKEIFSVYEKNLSEAINKYNRSHNSELFVERLTLNELEMLDLDKMTSIYAKYKIKDFKGVSDLNGLALSLVSGTAGKKRNNDRKDDPEIVI